MRNLKAGPKPSNTNCTQEAIKILEDCGYQQELINLIRTCSNKQKKEALAQQVIKLNEVTPTGLKAYLKRGRALLEASKNGVNPFDQYRPEVPVGKYLKPG